MACHGDCPRTHNLTFTVTVTQRSPLQTPVLRRHCDRLPGTMVRLEESLMRVRRQGIFFFIHLTAACALDVSSVSNVAGREERQAAVV